MRGKWAQGIIPRGFTWIVKDRVAVSERPGGCGESHRRVRRQEEIIWIREAGFDTVLSLLSGDHNLHAYDELGQQRVHLPFAGADDGVDRLLEVCRAIEEHSGGGRRLLFHREELNDVVCGLAGAWLIHAGLVDSGPRAISFAEQLTSRPLGRPGRAIVGLMAPSESADLDDNGEAAVGTQDT